MTQRTINLYDGLEALYYFDSDYFDGTTGEIKDKSGHGRHATANGGPTVGVNGPNNFEAANFSGGNSGDSFATGVTINPSNFTQAAVVKPTTSEDNVYNIIANHSKDDTSGHSIRFNGFTGRIEGTINGEEILITKDISISQYYIILSRFDGNTFTLSINDEIIGKETGVTFSKSTERTFIGSGIGNGRGFEGDIAIAGEWSRNLSDAEIEEVNRLTAPLRAQL